MTKSNSKGGFPISVLDWFNGGMVIGKCKLNKLQDTVTKTGVEFISLKAKASSVWSIVYGISSTAFYDEYDDIAEYVSDHLQTKAVFMYYDSCTGIVGYNCYDSGDLKESYLDELGDIEFESQWTKDKPIAYEDFDGLKIDFIDKRFGEIGISLPQRA